MTTARAKEYFGLRHASGGRGLLRILCVNFETGQIEQIQGTIFLDEFELAFEQSTIFQVQNPSFNPDAIDLILLFDAGNDNEIDTIIAKLRQIKPRRPIFVLTESIDEPRRIILENKGAQRVFSQHNVAEVLPLCIHAYFGKDSQAGITSVDPYVKGVESHYKMDQILAEPQALASSPLFLEALFNTIQSLVLLVDHKGKICFINKQAESLMGYTFEEIEGRNFSELFLLPEEEENIVQTFNQRRHDTKPNQYLNSMLTRSGTIKRIDWTSSVIESNISGEFYVLAVGVDVTEAYEQNRELSESREWFSKVFEHNPTGMAILSYREGRMIEANPRFRNLFRSVQQDVLGKSLHELGLLHPTDEWESDVLLKIQQKSMLTMERKVLTPEGHLLFVTLAFDTVELNGAPSILMSVHDLTDRMVGEEQSRKFALELEGSVLERSAALEAVNRELKSEIAFRKALESSTERLIQIIWETPDIVCIADLTGQLLYLNRAGRQILGVGETDTIAHLSIFGVYTEEFREFVNTHVWPHVEVHGVWRGETDFHLGEDKVIPVSQVIIGHKDQHGQIQFFSSVARDITDIHHASEELRLAYEKEKELGRLRASFFSMTSHQFRTPLSTILSSSELLEHYGSQWSVEKYRLHTQRIQKSTMRLSQMLNDILEYSKIEARQGNVQVEAIDLEELCLRLMNDLSVNDPDQHEFSMDCNINPCTVFSDRLSLELVVENLFSNAIKYSPRKSIITIRISKKDEVVNLSVLDQGIGILPGEVEMIFEPFHRGSNVVDTPGSGLGLMIVRKSLELIRGDISIQSNVGEGTEITIRIPDLRS